MTTAFLALALIATSTFSIRLYKRTVSMAGVSRPKIQWRPMKK